MTNDEQIELVEQVEGCLQAILEACKMEDLEHIKEMASAQKTLVTLFLDNFSNQKEL